MRTDDWLRRSIRYLALGLTIGLAVWWAGARWGGPQPVTVEAVPQRGAAAPAAATDLTEDESINVRVYQQASPAVANIVTRAITYDFFYGAQPVEGAGSGFLIDDRGHVLTNYHVIEGAESVEVVLGDIRSQKRYRARVVGGDQWSDLALLKIDPGGQKLVPLQLGDSDTLRVGQRVLAIGNPFGFQSTLTTGVVSALGRTVQTSERTAIDRAIQTDAAINRGNSGGPLLDSHGKVIGVNTAIFAPTGVTAGIGFAIPVNTAKQVASDLITEGRVRRGYLGIEGWPLWPEMASALRLAVSEGMLIERVTRGGPAERAGIRGGDRVVIAGMQRILVGGDVLVALDGEKVTGPVDLNRLLSRKRPGDTMTVTLYRGAQKMDVKVVLGER